MACFKWSLFITNLQLIFNTKTLSIHNMYTECSSYSFSIVTPNSDPLVAHEWCGNCQKTRAVITTSRQWWRFPCRIPHTFVILQLSWPLSETSRVHYFTEHISLRSKTLIITVTLPCRLSESVEEYGYASSSLSCLGSRPPLQWAERCPHCIDLL